MSPRVRDYQRGERVPGTVYEVVRLIGAGGMGTVYDVEDTTIGKRYVLKTLHPQLGARSDLARRMQAEARQLARLNHSNIVEVITAGVTGDDLRLPYYVMERLNGQSLRVVLDKKGQLDLPHAYHIALDLLDALDHAHDKGVIHRDVKPDNIFLHRTPAGITVTKLLDFGILALLDATIRDTAGRFLGTLRYAAPEQLRGEMPTPHVDLYAAGLVLYEMVAGRGPFDDEPDAQAIGAAHVARDPPPLSRFVDVPAELDALVLAALAKAPEDRPRDALSFAAALRQIKRAGFAVSPGESTGERSTAPRVLAPDSARVALRRPARQGSTDVPKTTQAGMTAPTLGGGSAEATAPMDITTPSAVDRRAPTTSFVPEPVGSPRHGTEPLAPGADRPPRRTGERVSAASEAPQVQTLSIAAPRSARLPVRPWLAVALLAGCAIGAAVWAHQISVRPEAGRETPSAVAPALAPPTPPSASTPPTPSVTPTASDAPGTARPPAQPPPPGIAPSARPRPAPGPSATKPQPPARIDRPGPGF